MLPSIDQARRRNRGQPSEPVPEPGQRVPPHNLEAEEALLGSMMLSPDAIRSARPLVTSDSFYRPSHAHIFEAIMALFSGGEPVDHVTVAEMLRRAGVLEQIGGEPVLVSIKANTPATSSAHRYAMIIAENALLRRLMEFAGRVLEGVHQPGDVARFVDEVRSELDSIELPTVELPKTLRTMEEMTRVAPLSPEWLVPGLIARGCKHMIVAPEGAGKSYVVRAIACLSSQGLWPFAPGDPNRPLFTPIRALVLDAENPDFVIAGAYDSMLREVRAAVPPREYDESRAWSWNERRRLDLRGGRDRALLEKVIRHVKPDLLCIGPLYKVFRTRPNERAEDAAEDLTDVFDDLIDRYRIGILIEHHAPKAKDGKRDLDPYGSQRWLANPDVGLKLIPANDEGTVLEVRRFRGDRFPLLWPTEIERGRFWPWRATKGPSWSSAAQGALMPPPQDPPYDEDGYDDREEPIF